MSTAIASGPVVRMLLRLRRFRPWIFGVALLAGSFFSYSFLFLLVFSGLGVGSVRYGSLVVLGGGDGIGW